ncbi:MAG TPA: hypothetical protein VN814_22350, partial [Caulobacteraceae bacterium]|nr:hypothetical protein [Caulobacteraceae bacterium]
AEGERARRRRRGRRGGRRMRDEARPGDVYGWSWPARPVGDDPYQWRGPVPAQLAPPGETAPAPVTAAFEPAPERGFEVADDAQPPVIDDTASVDVWVELPPADDAPRKGRARRGRSRAPAADATIVETPVVEPVETQATADAPAEPEAIEPVIAEAPAPVAEVAVAPIEAAPSIEEVVATVEPPPAVEPAPRPVDANEILAPPATPKRGWWRRGA